MLTYLLLAVSVLLGAAVVELAFAVRALAQAQRLTALARKVVVPVPDAVRGGSQRRGRTAPLRRFPKERRGVVAQPRKPDPR